MKFASAYNAERPYKPSPSGSRFFKKYIRAYNSDGVGELRENGVEDVYDSIQKAAQGITVDDLIRRAKSGDDSAILEPIDSYVDISGSPTDLLSAHAMLKSAHEKYDSLPAELRSQFGNNFEKFLKASADGSAAALVKKNSEASSVKPLSSQEVNEIRSLLGGNKNA